MHVERPLDERRRCRGEAGIDLVLSERLRSVMKVSVLPKSDWARCSVKYSWLSALSTALLGSVLARLPASVSPYA